MLDKKVPEVSKPKSALIIPAAVIKSRTKLVTPKDKLYRVCICPKKEVTSPTTSKNLCCSV